MSNCNWKIWKKHKIKYFLKKSSVYMNLKSLSWIFLPYTTTLVLLLLCDLLKGNPFLFSQSQLRTFSLLKLRNHQVLPPATSTLLFTCLFVFYPRHNYFFDTIPRIVASDFYLKAMNKPQNRDIFFSDVHILSQMLA